jgi:tetratricopeptide (TPR) repeat protein
MIDSSPAQRPTVPRRSSDVVMLWENGRLSYQAALDQLIALKAEAASDGNIADEAFVETRIGLVESARGSAATAIAHFERARELYLRADNRRQVITCSLHIGETYRLRGNASRARQYFRIGYEAALELGDRELQVHARASEAQMMMAQGHGLLAEPLLRECYGLAAEPYPVPAGATHDATSRAQAGQRIDVANGLATICLEQERYDEAWEFAEEAFSLATALGHDLRLGLAARVLADTITALGSPPVPGFHADPDVYYADSAAHFRAVNAEGEIARTLFAQGRSLGQRDRSTLAARKLHQAMVIFSRLGMVDDAARAAEEQLRYL